MEGDFFIGAALGTTLAKLALRYSNLLHDTVRQNRFTSEAMLIITSILNLGRSGKIFSLHYFVILDFSLTNYFIYTLVCS